MSESTTKRRVKWIFDGVQDLCEYAMIGLFAIMTVLATAQILIRFILSDFGVTAVWTEQLSRYLLVILTFIGAPYAMRTNDNISIRPLLERAPKGLQKGLITLSNALIVVFSLFVIWSVIEVLPRTINVPLSNFRSLTVGYAHIVLAVAFLFVLLYAIEETVELWQTGEISTGADTPDEEIPAGFEEMDTNE